MYENTTTRTATPATVSGDAATISAPSRDVLTEILRDGAQRLLGQAIEAEVASWIEQHTSLTDDRGRQQVVRNGHHPTRTLVSGVGPVEVMQPRVLDWRIIGQNQDGQDVGAAMVAATVRLFIVPVSVAAAKACGLRRATALGNPA